MSIYISVGIVSLLAVFGLLFYWLKKRRKVKSESEKEDCVADYGIEVNGINLQENKILGLYKVYSLESGKNYDITIPAGSFYTVVDKFSNIAISENWNTRYKPSRTESFHKITIDGNIIRVRWVNEVNIHPFLPQIIYVWR